MTKLPSPVYELIGAAGTRAVSVLALGSLPSIHHLAPLEEGGSTARTGFLYQDHVAAGFCIRMLRDTRLREVWCESEDDITLLWDFGSGTVVEFVQVKSDQLSQLWSVALLCGGPQGKSVLARSLAHDRCAEPCCFRIVTRADVHPDLHPLRSDRDHPSRCIVDATTLALHRKVLETTGDLTSERGTSASHWLAAALWEVCESGNAITNRNLLELHEYMEESDEPLFTDQMQELYERLLTKVQRAAFPKWKDGPERKKLQHDTFKDWMFKTVHRIKGDAPVKGGRKLREKMTAAQIAQTSIDNADRLRRDYRNRMLDPKYQQDESFRLADMEVTATMQHLVSNLDVGRFPDDGPLFHARCLDALSALRQNLPRVDLAYLQGALYAATDRCRHRFLKASG